MYLRIFIALFIMLIIYIILYIASKFASVSIFGQNKFEGFSSEKPFDPYSDNKDLYSNFALTSKPGNNEAHPVYTWMTNRKNDMWKPHPIKSFNPQGYQLTSLGNEKVKGKLGLTESIYGDSRQYCKLNPTYRACPHIPSKETIDTIGSNEIKGSLSMTSTSTNTK